MAEDLIRYDILAQDALRGMVRKVLSEVSRAGLPGEHHFYITVSTVAAGVRVSTRLLAQYPEEMTIVVQHQYWDLTVTEHAFEVGLSFSGIPERLFIPFSAVKAFADPSVGFQLQFAVVPSAALPRAEEKPAIALVQAPPADETPETPAAEAKADEAAAEEPVPAASVAQVVSLDAFRKK